MLGLTHVSMRCLHWGNPPSCTNRKFAVTLRHCLHIWADMQSARKLRWNLRSLGLSDTIIDAAWPEWWSEAAEASTSAQSELRFSIARKLGLDPKSLLEDQPRFVWRDEAKFKRLTSESEIERSALASFGISVGRALLSATPWSGEEVSAEPEMYRELILRRRQFITLEDLMALCWGIGIPVVYLRVFPLRAKKMNAMVVRIDGRFAILLARDANFPAPIAFYLAHELGHAALGHIKGHAAVVEFGDLLIDRQNASDDEETAADRYALELLTGMSAPRFVPEGSGFNAPAIANAVLQHAQDLHIEPGVMALCFGYSTGAWQRVFAALKMIYSAPLPVWMAVNRVAFDQLDWTLLNDDTRHFLNTVMGGEQRDKHRAGQ
jgi:hypothetical protein